MNEPVNLRILELCDLAQEWIDASKREARGMGSGSATMARSHDAAAHRFAVAVSEVPPSVLVEAFARLREVLRSERP